MDYPAFVKGHAGFRPCVAESKPVRQINGKALCDAAAEATGRIKAMTPAQAVDFLDTLAERLNAETTLASLVNEEPEVGLLQYDDSRLNVKIDMLLLEAAEAFYRCRQTGPAELGRIQQQTAQLMAKLRVVRKLRVQMWEFHQLQRNLLAAPGVADDGEEAKDRQRALLRLLLNLRMDNAHKRLDWVCYEQVVGGQPTGYFKARQSIKDFV